MNSFRISKGIRTAHCRKVLARLWCNDHQEGNFITHALIEILLRWFESTGVGIDADKERRRPPATVET